VSHLAQNKLHVRQSEPEERVLLHFDKIGIFLGGHLWVLLFSVHCASLQVKYVLNVFARLGSISHQQKVNWGYVLHLDCENSIDAGDHTLSEFPAVQEVAGQGLLE